MTHHVQTSEASISYLRVRSMIGWCHKLKGWEISHRSTGHREDLPDCVLKDFCNYVTPQYKSTHAIGWYVCLCVWREADHYSTVSAFFPPNHAVKYSLLQQPVLPNSSDNTETDRVSLKSNAPSLPHTHPKTLLINNLGSLEFLYTFWKFRWTKLGKEEEGFDAEING